MRNNFKKNLKVNAGATVSLNQKLFCFENGRQNVLTFNKCFSPVKYAISSKQISNSFDGLLLANGYGGRSILFNVTLRPYTILQLLIQAGTRLRAESAFPYVVGLQGFLVHAFLLCELWAKFVGQLGSNSKCVSGPYSLLRGKVPQLHFWVPEAKRAYS